MAKTNPCQVCGEVGDAEFTVSCFRPDIPPLKEGQPVVNVCLMCLIGWAYERTVELAEAAAAAGPETPALETIEATEDLGPLVEPEPNGHRPKSRPARKETQPEEVPQAAPAAHD